MRLTALRIPAYGGGPDHPAAAWRFDRDPDAIGCSLPPPPSLTGRRRQGTWNSKVSRLGYGFASRKSFTIGTIIDTRCISVTWVVLGKMANRDAVRGPRSPWVPPPFKRNISAT